MPTSTQYKALTIQNYSNSFYQSVIFEKFLISCFKDQHLELEEFTTLLSHIFGEHVPFAICFRLQQELNDYQQNGVFPISLNSLIQQSFLSRLAAHLRTEGASFLTDLTAEQIEEGAQSIEQGQVNPIAQQTLAHKLQVSIHIYLQNAQNLTKTQTVGASESAPISILQQETHYQPLINVCQLNDTQQIALQSLPSLNFDSSQNSINTKKMLTGSALKTLVEKTLAIFPERLDAISADISNPPEFNLWRASTEPSLTRLDTPNVSLPLRDLTEMSSDTALRDAYKEIVELCPNKAVESIHSWAGSLALTALAGATGGAIGLGLTFGIAEVGGILIGGAAGGGLLVIAPAALPVFLTCTLLTLAGGSVGKKYAEEYKKALQNASQLIEQDKIVEATEVLDREFNRWGINRALRKPFLTPAHYAVAHFFRGMCAEEERDCRKKAYQEYKQALHDAQETGAKVIILLLHVKLIELLRTHGQEVCAPNEQATDLIKHHLTELNHFFKDSLTSLYWQAQNNMKAIANLCNSHQSLFVNLRSIQAVLNIQSLFILEGYEEGHGSYLPIVYSFFQALIVAYVHFNNKTATIPEIRQLLMKHLSSEGTASLIDYVLAKLKQTFQQLLAFNTIYPKLEQQPAFSQCNTMMKEFAIGICSLLDEGENHLEICGNIIEITKLLNVSPSAFLEIKHRHNASTQFLMKINDEFGLTFTNINEWLKELNGYHTPHFFNSISVQTQNNMLHMLAQLPKGLDIDTVLLKSVAAKMKGMIYARNHQNQTPLSLLEQEDPYSIKSLVCGPKLVPLGNELRELDDFISIIEGNVDKEGHFVLLQGPPGTGKSEAVLTHLRAKGFEVMEWQGGEENDKYVGQLSLRVIEFFNGGKNKAESKKTSKSIILFIDEINGVCPETSGIAKKGESNYAQIVNEFQKQISGLKGHNVVLIGATNYPENLSKAIKNRMTPIQFPVPDESARKRLLTHLFRFNCISEKLIERISELTQGWSPRQLAQMVEQIKSHEVDSTYLSTVFEKAKKLCEEDFKKEFKSAYLMLPMFEPIQQNASEGTDDHFKDLKNALACPELYQNVSIHTLLYGPPGSGKTTAIREFARDCNCPFLLIESGTSPQEIFTIFERAKSYTSAIICIDEIDKIAHNDSPVKVFLQEQMDGLIRNNLIIVGATNYPDKIAEPIFSRFGSKIAVPLPTPAQVGLFIQREINESLKRLPQLVIDEELNDELSQNCLRLGDLSSGLSYRDLKSAIARLFARIQSAQPQTTHGLTHTDLRRCIDEARQALQPVVAAHAQNMMANAKTTTFFKTPVTNEHVPQPVNPQNMPFQ
ncbi:AAA family ATPase [Legionella yabuuchiae]|uniref:AAA family ATPase n=1 Tax=Legionella yabuuchiae TaxID=376727 RepID=UPI0010562EB9|nr:ATP-binding protein [Legionella yabuuchiae]